MFVKARKATAFIAMWTVTIVGAIGVFAPEADAASKLSGPTPKSCNNVQLAEKLGKNVGKSDVTVAKTFGSPGFQMVKASAKLHSKLESGTWTIGLADLVISDGKIVGCSIGYTTADPVVVKNGKGKDKFSASGLATLYTGRHALKVIVARLADDGSFDLSSIYVSERVTELYVP